jgi:hypothetical protein
MKGLQQCLSVKMRLRFESAHRDITHPSGSIMILASANYIPEKLGSLETDISMQPRVIKPIH